MAILLPLSCWINKEKGFIDKYNLKIIKKIKFDI